MVETITEDEDDDDRQPGVAMKSDDNEQWFDAKEYQGYSSFYDAKERQHQRRNKQQQQPTTYLFGT